MAGIAKSATTPAHMTTLPVRSHRPDQASTVGLIKIALLQIVCRVCQYNDFEN